MILDRRPILLVCGLALFAGAPVLAGEYSLVSGQGEDVCEAYRQNFEPRKDAEPMVCERRYDPTISGFSPAQWQPLDTATHLDLYRKILLYAAETDSSPQGLKPKKRDMEALTTKDLLNARANSLRLQMYVARLNLRGDGHLWNVLAIKEHRCGSPRRPEPLTSLFLVNDSATELDYSTMKESSWWGWSNNSTLELFRGVPYIESYVPDDNWAHAFNGKGRLQVRRGNGEPVCEIEFTPKPLLSGVEK